MYNDLILNASLLVALTSIYNLLARVRKGGKLWVKILFGLLFGGVAIAGMRLPFHYAQGVIYDGRSIVLSMAGLYGGGIVTLVSVLVAGTYRAFLGGPGVWAGMATILFCGLTGLAFRRHHKNLPGSLNLLDLYIVGIVAHIVMLACQLLVLPFPNGIAVISRIWMPVLLIFPIATVLMGVLLRTEERNLMAHEEVKSSGALYHNLIETSQDLIWRCDISGCYTYLNPAWENVFGYKIEEMLGKKFTDFQTAEYAERDNIEFARLLQGNTIKGLETVHIGKDGRDIHLVFNAKFLVDDQGRPAGTSGTAYDITERKKFEQALQDSEEKFRSLFNKNNAIMLLFDSDTQEILDTNPAASAYYGWSQEELICKKVSDLDTLSEEEINFEKRKAVREQRTSYELKHRLSSGEIRDVEVYSSPIQHKGKTLLFSIVHDITKRKLAEKELKENLTLLVRTNEVTVDRELLMYELKKEVNALLVQAGKEEKYQIREKKNI